MKQEQPDRKAWTPILELCEAQVADANLDDLYQQALTIIQREMEAERVALMLSQGLEFVTVAVEGLSAETVAGLRVRVPDDVVEQLATSTQAIPLRPDEAPWASSLWEPFQGSVMAQPLSVAKRLVGLLVLSRDHMQLAELELLAILGSQIAGAIDRDRWFRDGLRHVTELNTVNEIGQLLSTVLDPEQLLSSLRQQVGRVLDTSNFYVALYDEDTGQLHFPFCWDTGQPLQEPARPLQADEQASKTDYVIHTGEPFLSQWDTLGLLPIRELESSPHVPRSYLGIPLLRGDRLLGMMAVQDYERENAYDESDLNLLITVAAQAAAALENARLFQDRERRITELSTLNEMSRALSSALELDDLLEVVYQQVGRLFGTADFYIATYEEESAEWTAVFDVEDGQRQPRTRYKVEAGVTGYIIRTRQPLLFHTAEGSVAFEKAQGFETIGKRATSWMGVPLIAADKVVGVMAIQNYEHEHLYSEEDLALFSTIGAQVAVAIENLRLLEEIRRRARELGTVNEVGRTITSTLDLDAVLRQIVDAAKERFGHYFSDIFLIEGDQLVLREGSLIGESGTRLARGYFALDLQGSGLITESARTGQPVLVSDVRQDPRYIFASELADTLSELVVPIEVKGRIIGVLDVQSDQLNAFDQADVALLQALASQAGVAIENARLFRRQERRITELAILNEIGRAVSSALQLDELLETIHQQVNRLFDTTNFYIAFYYEDTDEWDLPLHLEHGRRQPTVRRRVKAGLTGHIIRNRQSVLLRSAEENLAFKEAQGIEALGELARSWLGVPLLVADKVVGVMAIQSYEQEHLYGEEDLALFATIAAQAAIAIQNARLFEEAQRLAATVAELSTPVIQVWDQVLVLPLVGGIDEGRSQRIMEALLQGITRHHAKVVIIDVTGVPLIDSWVADHLLHTAQAAELLGARCVLTGISPEVAQSIVSLGLPLTGLITLPNLQAGIRYALSLLRRL